jgi:membrane-bound serine protease (ClpP class)
MRSSRRLLVLVAILALLGSLALASAEDAQQDFVYSIEIKGDINAGTADFISKSIDRAERDNTALIIKLDTPGGLLSATEDIVDDILRDRVRTAVYVTPPGSWAYSAGTFILLSSNVAAMDHNTALGAAKPIPSDEKTVNAMATWIKTIAENRGRPPEIAENFVRESDTMTSEEALEENVIDLIADNIDEVLVYMGLEGAEVREIEMGWVSKFLSIISNPQIVVILFILGLFGLIAEITTPGIGLPGIAGVICLLLALWGMGIVEVNYVGVVLIGLGAILLAYEVLTPGFGVFGGGGIAALVLGLMMVDKEPWVEVVGNVAKGIVLGVVAALSILLLLVRRAMRRPVAVGKEDLIGKIGVATTNLAPKGFVRLKGERWSAVCKGRIRKGEKVVVKDVKGITLIVKRHRRKSG